MSNVVPLRRFEPKDGMTAEQRAVAWSNYYQAELAQGTDIETAHGRADAFLDHRFAAQMASIRCILDEVSA